MALTDMLTDIANAIRAKTGKSSTMTPTEMPGEILAIPSGGGDIDSIIDGSVTEIYSESKKIVDYALYRRTSLTSVDLPRATSIGDYALYYCISLTSVDLTLATSIGSYALQFCTSLTSVDLPRATSIGTYAFRNCTSLTSVDLTLATSIGIYAFADCTSLTSVDLPRATSIGTAALAGCIKLDTLVLRSSTRASLGNAAAFVNTPIANGTGYIYVPASLVESYKAATNWVTYANQIRAIEDYPEITGGAQ